MKVIGFTYDADYHCTDCTREYIYNYTNPKFHAVVRRWLETGDGEGVIDPRDSEGNEIHPIFDTDEWQQFEGGVETLNCSDCGAEMDRYDDS